MRTPKELAVHAFAYIRCIPGGVVNGKLTAEGCTEPVADIKTKADLVKWCRESFEIASRDFEKLTDAQLAAMVDTLFGQPFPGWMLLTIAYDEHLHHRGQIFAFLRALAVEPPFIWSFEENDAAFQPKQTTA